MEHWFDKTLMSLIVLCNSKRKWIINSLPPCRLKYIQNALRFLTNLQGFKIFKIENTMQNKHYL